MVGIECVEDNENVNEKAKKKTWCVGYEPLRRTPVSTSSAVGTLRVPHVPRAVHIQLLMCMNEFLLQLYE